MNKKSMKITQWINVICAIILVWIAMFTALTKPNISLVLVILFAAWVNIKAIEMNEVD